MAVVFRVAVVFVANLALFASLGLFTALGTASLFAGEIEQLTHDGSNKRDPRFIAGGDQIIYCYDETPSLIRMMKMNAEELKPTLMFADSGNKHQLEPSFSPDQRYMVFTECTGNLSARLVIRDLRDKKDAAITHQGRGGTRSPCFSPTSDLVVYAFAETGPQQLWSVKPDGSDKKQLTECQGISNWPTFTPDGKRLVFGNSRANNYEIYSMNLDGTDERRLTENSLMDIRPQVSPDGKRIAFTSTRGGTYDVYVMNIDGTNVKQITDSEERNDYPAWHPDGTHLLYVGERGGRFDLFLAEVP